MSRILGSEDINSMTVWGKSFLGIDNRHCKGPEVEKRGPQNWTGTTRGGLTTGHNEVVGTNYIWPWALLVSELEATGWFGGGRGAGSNNTYLLIAGTDPKPN